MLNLIRIVSAIATGLSGMQAAETPTPTAPPAGTYSCIATASDEPPPPELVILSRDRYRDGAGYGHYEYDPAQGRLRFRSGPFDVRPYGTEWVGVLEAESGESSSAPTIDVRDLRKNSIVQRCSLRAR
jgi:hypothetical protein